MDLTELCFAIATQGSAVSLPGMLGLVLDCSESAAGLKPPWPPCPPPTACELHLRALTAAVEAELHGVMASGSRAAHASHGQQWRQTLELMSELTADPAAPEPAARYVQKHMSKDALNVTSNQRLYLGECLVVRAASLGQS